MNTNNEIAVFDFGSQYTHLIARRVRDLGVKSHIYPNNARVDRLKNAVGIILSGGPKSVTAGHVREYDHTIFDLDLMYQGAKSDPDMDFAKDLRKGKVEETELREFVIRNVDRTLKKILRDQGFSKEESKEFIKEPSCIWRDLVTFVRLCLDWIQKGGFDSFPAKKVTNEFFDLRYAVIASYGERFLSSDKKANWMYNELGEMIQMKQGRN